MIRRLLLAAGIVALVVLVPVPTAWSTPATRVQVLGGTGAEGGAAAPFPASHLGVRWHGDHDAQVHVRWQEGGAWQPWQAVTVAHDLEDTAAGVIYGGLVRAPGATHVQTRVVAGAAAGVEVAAIDTEHGPRHLVRAERPAGAEEASAALTPAPPQPPIVSRSQWGADESLRKPTPPLYAPITKLVVHHSATTSVDPDPTATVRAIYAFHTQVRGWDDIGYNFLVDAQGRIYEGRWARDYAFGEVPTGEDLLQQGVVGAHAEGFNTGSAGIALLGDFTFLAPTPAAMASLESWLAWKAARHDIDPAGASLYRAVDGTTSRPANIAGHRDVGSTECPGGQLYVALPGLRARITRTAGPSVRLTRGYWVAGANGAVYPLGAAPPLGDARRTALSQPVRGMAATATGRGYWLVGGDGGVFAYGDAGFHGSTGALRLNKPIVGMAATPTGNGYWLVASDGGIFSYGDAAFSGSTGALRLNKPIVGMAPTPTGKGYWLVATDGGIFAFGDAAFAGSTGAMTLNSPIEAMEPARDGSGYWLIARDGGVFAFGVPFFGSVPGLNLASYGGSAAMRASGRTGYYVLGGDGGVFAFGQAEFFGSRPGLTGAAVATDLVLFDAPVALT